MKHKLMFLSILFIGVLHTESYGQENKCACKSFDSVRVEYYSLEEGPLFVTLSLNDNKVSLFKEDVDNPLNRFTKNILIYKTHRTDTIDYLSSWIKTILDNPPIYDTTYEILGYGQGMYITIFENNETCRYKYIHYWDALFPFAYAELYSFIRQKLALYNKKK